MSSSILEYLSRPNPTLDNSQSLRGDPTTIRSMHAITGMRPWTEFKYETLMALYEDVLQQTLLQSPDVDPPLTSLETRIFDEDSLEHLISRAIVPTVNYSLEHAWKYLYPRDVCPQVTRGGRAKKSASEDKRLYPDWAGVHDSFKTELGFKNICPGDTKLSTKWASKEPVKEKLSYYFPMQQIQEYCGGAWNVRYGYLITQAELVVFRISKEEIGPGIASTRSKRDHQFSVPGNFGNVELQRQRQPHQRVVSDTSTRTPMSVDEEGNGNPSSPRASSKEDRSYQPHHGSVEYNPIEFKSIPWDESGKGKLTVKLALWWLHMMAAAPGCDTSVKTEYPPLDSWSTSSDGKSRHSSTGVVANKPPLGRPTEPSTSASQRRPVTASQSVQSGFQQSLPSRSRPTPAGRESQRESKPVEEKGKGRMR